MAHWRAAIQEILLTPYEIFVGLRYTRARRGAGRNGFVSFIAFTSMAGIALGVAALIVVLSVMNGFHDELRNRILSVASHIEIHALSGNMENWEAVARAARANPRVKAEAPYVLGQAMLSSAEQNRGALIRGVDPELEDTVANIGTHMRSGLLSALKAGEFGIVLGAELARALGVRTGDSVVVIIPQGTVTPAGTLPRVKSFHIVGVFEIGMFEFDNGLALIHLADAQKLYRMGDAVTGVRLKLDDLFAAPMVARELMATVPIDTEVRDWTLNHANFFRAVAIEKRVMFIILTLIVAVAAFNIVSAQVMVVTDKQADIAILRTLGASPRSILTIFIIQGALVGIVGTILGVAGGVALALNIGTVVPAIERTLGIQFLDNSIYYISELPSDLQRGDITLIALIALSLALLATLYPSWRAAKVNPAEALRYE